MVMGVITSDGEKDNSLFYKFREKVGADSYYKVLKYHVLSWLKISYPEGNSVDPGRCSQSHSKECAEFRQS